MFVPLRSFFHQNHNHHHVCASSSKSSSCNYHPVCPCVPPADLRSSSAGTHKSMPTTPIELTPSSSSSFNATLTHDPVTSAMAALHLSPRVVPENPHANRFLYHSKSHNSSLSSNAENAAPSPTSSGLHSPNAAVCICFVFVLKSHLQGYPHDALSIFKESGFIIYFLFFTLNHFTGIKRIIRQWQANASADRRATEQQY